METNSSLEEKASEKTWQTYLAEEKQKPYFKKLLDTVKQEMQKKVIYPKSKDIFNALKLTPFEKVKVVIIGQDPYHGPNQAHGLAFSVQKGVATPPSLQNIFQELKNDLNISPPNHGCLEEWAKQGVLLLNTVLTVEAGKAHSHANLGWETFTDKIIQILNDEKENLVFLLWGSHAQKKGLQIDPTKHHILKAPHPSPLSAHRGFLGCRHFSKTNAFLEKVGKEPINWSLS
jgi:uracil-DNA glycosylase